MSRYTRNRRRRELRFLHSWMTSFDPLEAIIGVVMTILAIAFVGLVVSAFVDSWTAVPVTVSGEVVGREYTEATSTIVDGNLIATPATFYLIIREDGRSGKYEVDFPVFIDKREGDRITIQCRELGVSKTVTCISGVLES